MNLAKALDNCLKKWEIDNKLGAIVADNASTNDVMISELAVLNPWFKGTAMHIRCFDHTLNLMAKAVLSAFYPPKTKNAKKSCSAKSSTGKMAS